MLPDNWVQLLATAVAAAFVLQWVWHWLFPCKKEAERREVSVAPLGPVSPVSPNKLFEPLQLGGMTLKNRVIKAATHDGATFEDMHASNVRLARNEVAMVTIAYVAIDRRDKTFDNQHCIEVGNMAEWRNLVDAVHREGAKICAQLHHPGFFCMSGSGIPRGPSAGWLPSSFRVPRVLSTQQVEDLVSQYATAAYLCKQVGFDAVELHCGHGYLLSQFLTPVINRRRDRYGGSVAGRATFPCEALRAVKKACGLPVLVKMNLDDGLPYGLPGGLKLPEAIETARILARAGADAIIPSFGYTSLNGFGMLRGGVPIAKMVEAVPSAGARFILRALGGVLVPKIKYNPLFLRDASTELLRTLRRDPLADSCKVIYIGGADNLDGILGVLGDGFDGVQMARALLREPYFVRRLQRGVRERERAAAEGREAGADARVKSKCCHANLCTLASLNENIKPGCYFLKPGDVDIEEPPPRGA